MPVTTETQWESRTDPLRIPARQGKQRPDQPQMDPLPRAHRRILTRSPKTRGSQSGAAYRSRRLIFGSTTNERPAETEQYLQRPIIADTWVSGR
jgi:hypothetical protein